MMAARMAASSASVSESTPLLAGAVAAARRRTAAAGRSGPRRPARGRPRRRRPCRSSGLPLIFHTTARSIRPPSSGRPGSRLKTATIRLLTISPASSTPGTVPGSTSCMPPKNTAGEHQGEQRADEGEHELPAGGVGLLLDLRDAAEELELDAAHRQLEAERGDGVGEFVDEHGGVEGDGEEERDQVAGRPELGQDGSSWPPKTQVIRAATRNQLGAT